MGIVKKKLIEGTRLQFSTSPQDETISDREGVTGIGSYLTLATLPHTSNETTKEALASLVSLRQDIASLIVQLVALQRFKRSA